MDDEAGDHAAVGDGPQDPVVAHLDHLAECRRGEAEQAVGRRLAPRDGKPAPQCVRQVHAHHRQCLRGIPVQFVREVRGVRWVNDSKATNTAAARRALTAFDAPLHLILGGSLKGESFDGLAAAVAAANVVTAYLVGEAAEPLASSLGSAGVPFLLASTLERAVAAAASAARPGDVVLLSPACASYDQFRDFEHRGEEFRRLVENL